MELKPPATSKDSVPTEWIYDITLPLKVKGILAIMHFVADATGHLALDDIMGLSGDSIQATRGALATLVKSGYAERLADRGDDGRARPARYRMLPPGQRRDPDLRTPTSIYRHFDELGELLYVGITRKPKTRERAHRRNSVWHVLSARRTEEWVESEALAAEAEAVAIRTESPLFNDPDAGATARMQRTHAYCLSRGLAHVWHAFLRGTAAEGIADNILAA